MKFHRIWLFWLKYSPNRSLAGPLPQTPLEKFTLFARSPSWFRGWDKRRGEEREGSAGANLSESLIGVARISKLGGTPVSWSEGPMRRWGFGGRAAQWAPSHQLGGLGRAVDTIPTPPDISDLHESCGHACRR